jgi:hypothetical protein
MCVGLRGFRLNLAVLTYTTSPPPARTHPHATAVARKRRISNRLQVEIIERMVAEYGRDDCS